MRKLLGLASILALVILGFAAQAATPVKKKSVAKKGTKTVATAHRKTGSSAASPTKATSAKSTAARRGKKGPVRKTTWRNRQLTPTPERYKEIQAALSAKGYLPAEQANGKWNDSSTEALKKFQSEQSLAGNGKINSLSLIALGLGPKRETAASAKPTAAPAVP